MCREEMLYERLQESPRRTRRPRCNKLRLAKRTKRSDHTQLYDQVVVNSIWHSFFCPGQRSGQRTGQMDSAKAGWGHGAALTRHSPTPRPSGEGAQRRLLLVPQCFGYSSPGPRPWSLTLDGRCSASALALASALATALVPASAGRGGQCQEPTPRLASEQHLCCAEGVRRASEGGGGRWRRGAGGQRAGALPQ